MELEVEYVDIQFKVGSALTHFFFSYLDGCYQGAPGVFKTYQQIG
jgi:hypothetical protein